MKLPRLARSPLPHPTSCLSAFPCCRAAEAAKLRLKDGAEESQPAQPATEQPAQKRPRLASLASDGNGGAMLAYASLLGGASGTTMATALAGALDPALQPGALAAAAAQEAADTGASLADAAAAAGAAAAVALHPVPLVKSSQ